MMIRPTRVLILTHLIAAGLIPLLASATEPASIPVSAFFRNPAFSNASLSPDGTAVAFRLRGKTGMTQLGIYDIADGKARSLVHFGNADVGFMFWLNEKRLVFNTINVRQQYAKENDVAGVAAINRDGSRFKQLSEILEHRDTFDYDPAYQSAASVDQVRYSGYRPDGRRFPIVIHYDDAGSKTLGEMDAFTGDTNAVGSPSNTHIWVLDEQANLRAALRRTNNVTSVSYLDATTGKWQQVGESTPDALPKIDPVHFSSSGFYVTAPYQGVASLFRVDMLKAKLEPQPLVTAPGFDIDPTPVMADKKLAGFVFSSDAPTAVWLDSRMKSLQAEIDMKLVGSVNTLVPARDTLSQYLLIRSVADRKPDTYLLYDTVAKTFNGIGTALPEIDYKSMTEYLPVRYKARDGRSIPAWVAFPKDRPRKDLKLVILLDDSPWKRSLEWRFQPKVQFLTSRGYAVVQPQPRGMHGYGIEHAQAGFGELGGKIQDDIEDAARWAIAQGWTKEGSICLAGGQFGGFAALTGLARSPSLFKCGIAWATFTDLPGMFTAKWPSVQDVELTYLRKLLPDPLTDLERLRAISPITFASAIRQPVLFAYGEEDIKVPVIYSRAFFKKLSAANPAAEAAVFDINGKRAPYEENRIELWTRIEAFLAKHLK